MVAQTVCTSSLDVSTHGVEAPEVNNLNRPPVMTTRCHQQEDKGFL